MGQANLITKRNSVITFNDERLSRRESSDDIKVLRKTEVFVFGSNEAGIHGAGAALIARERFGAITGRGFGKMGNSYAIPTKDKNLRVLSLNEIKEYVDLFVSYTQRFKEDVFLVTKVGCGLAGYSVEQMAPLFIECIAIPNIFLPKDFWDFYALEGVIQTIKDVKRR